MSVEEIDNGGPAFPMVCLGDPGHPGSVPGMSLRDWFAGQALTGLGGWTPDGPEVFNEYGMRLNPGTPEGDVAALKIKARWAYQQADAMLKAREVRS